MKTPIQELIEKLENSSPKVEFLLWFQNKENQKQFLQKEKEVIIEAHNKGKNILPPNENGEQYYQETFGEINPKPHQ